MTADKATELGPIARHSYLWVEWHAVPDDRYFAVIHREPSQIGQLVGLIGFDDPPISRSSRFDWFLEDNC